MNDNLSARLDSRNPLPIREKALDDLTFIAAEPLRRFVIGKLGAQSPDADDVINATWEAVIARVLDGGYEDRGSDPISFVVGVAQNMVLRQYVTTQSHLRREVTPSAAEESGGTDIRLLAAESGVDLDTLYAQLEPEEQQYFQLMRAGYSISEMASRFGCSYRTAWRYYHRVIERCRGNIQTVHMPQL
jgi:RNA polymerase sigma factor (sigma-70 family)